MSEEGAPHTLSLAHAESQTHTSASSSTHTGGPMQLQATTDSEEKKVSTLMLGASSLFFFFFPSQPCLNLGTAQKHCRSYSFKGCFFFFFYLAQCRLCCDCQLSGPSESHSAVHSSLLEFNPFQSFCVAGD